MAKMLQVKFPQVVTESGEAVLYNPDFLVKRFTNTPMM